MFSKAFLEQIDARQTRSMLIRQSLTQAEQPHPYARAAVCSLGSMGKFVYTYNVAAPYPLSPRALKAVYHIR